MIAKRKLSADSGDLHVSWVPEREASSGVAASVRSVSKHFKKTTVLEDISFDVSEGESLVLDEKISGPGGWRGTNLVKYSLADNGKTLIALEREEDPKSKSTNRWVFYNKPAPPPPKPGESGSQKSPPL